jgi:hypothetical protein
MSEFTTVKLEYNDESSLLESLKNMGFNPTCHKNGVKLDTYYSSREKPTAHIVVSKQEFVKMGGRYAGFGFEKVGDKYVLHIDDMDKKKLDMKKMNKLYGESRLMKVVNASSKYSVKSRSEETGRTVVKLNVNF